MLDCLFAWLHQSLMMVLMIKVMHINCGEVIVSIAVTSTSRFIFVSYMCLGLQSGKNLERCLLEPAKVVTMMRNWVSIVVWRMDGKKCSSRGPVFSMV